MLATTSFYYITPAEQSGPEGAPFFTTKIVPLSGETYFLRSILVILAKMSAFGPFWEPDFYVSSLKGTISMDIFGPIFGGTPDTGHRTRTDGHTDVTNGRTSDFLDSLHNSPFGAII